jgi:hypothetical protein
MVKLPELAKLAKKPVKKKANSSPRKSSNNILMN